MVSLKEFAESLDDSQYRTFALPSDILMDVAKENGIVVIYGASDDLIEMDGYLRDEISHWDSNAWKRTFHLTVDKKLSWSSKNSVGKFTVNWCNGDFTWEFSTDIPHETFSIFDEDRKFCKGIVFYAKDVDSCLIS